MKKISISLAMVGLFACAVMAHPDFHLSKWGDTIEEVKAAEDLLPLVERPSNGILYDTVLEGWIKLTNDGSRPKLYQFLSDTEISVSYMFKDGKLYSAMYFIPLEDVLPRYHRSLYTTVRSTLIAKYGDPAFEWDSTLRYWSQWNTEKTVIQLNINLTTFVNAASVTYNSEKWPDVDKSPHRMMDF